MRRAGLITFACCLALMSARLQARIAPQASGATPVAAPLHVSLNGPWRLFYFPQGKYQITQPDQLKAQGLTWIEASVPGEAPLDLIAINS